MPDVIYRKAQHLRTGNFGGRYRIAQHDIKFHDRLLARTALGPLVGAEHPAIVRIALEIKTQLL
jgi:hypothetical protein